MLFHNMHRQKEKIKSTITISSVSNQNALNDNLYLLR